MNFKLFLASLVAALCISFSARADTAEGITLRECRLLDTSRHPNGILYDLWLCGTRGPFAYVMLPVNPLREGDRDLFPMGPPLKRRAPGIDI